MKRISKILTVVLSLCLLLSVGVFASGEPSAEASGEPSAEASGDAAAIAPGTYTDGVYTLVIADDMTFVMEKDGENMDGAAFSLTVTGSVENNEFVLSGLWDGTLNVFEMATDDQKAADLASVVAVYAAATAAPAAAGAPAPGTYTDGVNTLVIADDMTFVMEKTGEGRDGAAFNLTVTGYVDEAGEFVLNGLWDGTLNVFEMATEDQKAADLASVYAAFAG